VDRFKIEISPAASRDLDDLDVKTVTKVLSDLKALENNPFPRGNLIKKIKGKKKAFYRLRIDKFRVFFAIEGIKIILLRVLSKKEAEQFIKRF
jgi:mRNA-degrading endonuclease RelE of RelBE toxin-antitoxin system